MKKNIKRYLWISSFLLAAGIYLLVTAYKILHFEPVYDTSDILSIYLGEIHPEIEVPLYIVGWFSLVFGGGAIYSLLYAIFFRYLKEKALLSSQLLLRGVVAATAWLIYEQVIVYHVAKTFPTDVAIYNGMVCGIVLLSIFFSKYERILRNACIVFDMLAVVCVFIVFFFLFLSIFGHAFDATYIQAFLPYYSNHFIDSFSLTYLTAILIVVSGISIVWFGKRSDRLHIQKRWIRILIHCSVLGYIAFWVSVIPNPVTFGLPAYFQDFHPFVAPINDVLGGKTILVNSLSQYGVLVIYTLVGLFHVIPLTYNIYFLVLYVSTFVGYAALYIILVRWVGLAAALTGIFFIAQPFVYLPGILRYGWWIILLGYIAFRNNIKNKWIQTLIEFICIGYAVFWAFDAGMYALIAYSGYVVVTEFLRWRRLTPSRSLLIFIASASKRFIAIGGSVVFYFLVINLATYLRAGVLPDWRKFYGVAFDFVGGWGLRPLPQFGPHLYFFLIYFIALVYILWYVFFSNETDNQEQDWRVGIVSFVTGYGIIQTSYYMGRSMGGHDLAVQIPSIMLFCWLITEVRGKLHGVQYKKYAFRFRILFGCIAGIGILVFSTFTSVFLTNNIQAFITRQQFTPKFDEVNNQGNMKAAIEYVNTYLTNKKSPNRKIALLSEYDNYLLVTTHSVNIISSNNFDYFHLKSQMDTLGKELMMLKPEVLFVQHDVYNQEGIPRIFSYVQNEYHVTNHVGMLDIWERNGS